MTIISIISFSIINNGWKSNNYQISITNNSNINYSESIYVDANTKSENKLCVSQLYENSLQDNDTINLFLNITSVLNTQDQLSYNLNLLLEQNNFYDINNDCIINVIDITIIINCILWGSCLDEYDVHSDGIIDILDIIDIVNFIINE